jgi:hypothetical protein
MRGQGPGLLEHGADNIWKRLKINVLVAKIEYAINIRRLKSPYLATLKKILLTSSKSGFILSKKIYCP